MARGLTCQCNHFLCPCKQRVITLADAPHPLRVGATPEGNRGLLQAHDIEGGHESHVGEASVLSNGIHVQAPAEGMGCQEVSPWQTNLQSFQRGFWAAPLRHDGRSMSAALEPPNLALCIYELGWRIVAALLGYWLGI
jgi:hypothetical protein